MRILNTYDRPVMVTRRRAVLIGSFILFGAVAIYLWLFGWTTVLAIQPRSLGKQNPTLYKLPAPLVESSVSPSSGRKFSVGQFEFEVPWSNIDEAKTTAPQNWVRLSSSDGLGMLVIATKPDSLVAMLRADKEFGPKIRELFEPEILQSDYSLAKYMLETTPDRVQATAPKREDVDRLTMLTLKAIILPQPASSGIFQIVTPEFHGFQFGDARKAPNSIVADLYSADGKVKLIFTKKNGPLNQSEINRVLQSLHKKTN